LRNRSGAAVALALAAAVIGGTGAVNAHRRDEFLQAARLDVEPGRVELELDLTPGIAVAAATIEDLDRDGDKVLSDDEKRAFAVRAMDAVVMELDGRAVHLELNGSTFPRLNDFRRGEGTIQLHAIATLANQADGDHRLSFRNTGHRDGSVYLANALVPTSDRITITTQRRDPMQRDLAIDYVLRRGSVTSAPSVVLGALSVVTALAALLMRAKQA
jgi:hypothetical protein